MMISEVGEQEYKQKTDPSLAYSQGLQVSVGLCYRTPLSREDG